ncbi:MAG: hypothetical protein H7061_00120 [Bdellovibrionaceae bacterium]|nr:hypothetical protein [Bdellovibrio sp.]
MVGFLFVSSCILLTAASPLSAQTQTRAYAVQTERLREQETSGLYDLLSEIDKLIEVGQIKKHHKPIFKFGSSIRKCKF